MIHLQIVFHSWLMFYASCFFGDITKLCFDFLFFLVFVRTLFLVEELSPLLNLECSSSSVCWVKMS